MANRVLSIEIGQSLIRVLEVSGKGRETRIHDSFSFSTPENMFEKNDSKEFADILKDELKKRKIATKKVLFVINSSRMATREVTIPAVKENRIDDLIVSNASEYFPVDLSQYVLVHEIIERFTEEGSKKLRLNVLAIPNDIIDFYGQLAKDSGLTLEGMGYTGTASKQLLLGDGSNGVRALLKIDGRSSLVTIMDGNKVELQRHVGYGVAEAVTAVCENGWYGHLNFIEGLEILRKYNLLFDVAKDENQDGIYEEHEISTSNVKDRLKEDVTESLKMVSGSIARILDYYQSRNQENRIRKVSVIGLGADIEGFTEFLGAEFGINTEKLPLIRGVSLDKNPGDAEYHMATYYSCLGVTLKGGELPALSKKKNELSFKREGKEVKMSSGSLALPAILSALLIVGAGAWFAISFFAYNEAKEENLSINNKINELSYIENVIKDNETAKAEYDWVANAMKLTTTNNNGLKSIIEQLERKMPSDIRVLSLDATNEVISLNVTVSSKDSAADMIKRIREFDNVAISNISTITETKEKDERTEVNFTVDLAYVNLEKNNEAVAEDTSKETKSNENESTENKGENK